jgi:hypothetical protein
MGLVFPLLAFSGGSRELVFAIAKPSIKEFRFGLRIPLVARGILKKEGFLLGIRSLGRLALSFFNHSATRPIEARQACKQE